ncbi:GatB/YqeY [Mycolicibacterium sp. BiH015]|uniref:GatB/YqeY n=1 Tax=Mycolicibacterium sp. BiH015 TaxID=3018808 RepID=UPI0022E054CA|nr:GatB/YqeY [Mycolicibacterium sp. BiH015]MDA2890774.1 GatB/YqeY [Mycolicibacterium sp. BiH015]
MTETGHRVPADRWRTELRSRLLVARKNRDALRTSVLRSVLSAVDNAETPRGPIPQAGAIADSAAGVGAAEVARRVLTDAEIRLLIRQEIDDRLGAAEQTASSRPERTSMLREEARILAAILAEV